MTVELSAWHLVVSALTLLGGGGSIVALVRVFTDRPKVRADAVKIITEASATSSAASAAAVVNLAERLERVEKKADEQGQQLEVAEHKISRLVDYVDRVSSWAHRHKQLIISPPFDPFPEFDDPAKETA